MATKASEYVRASALASPERGGGQGLRRLQPTQAFLPTHTSFSHTSFSGSAVLLISREIALEVMTLALAVVTLALSPTKPGRGFAPTPSSPAPKASKSPPTPSAASFRKWAEENGAKAVVPIEIQEVYARTTQTTLAHLESFASAFDLF